MVQVLLEPGKKETLTHSCGYIEQGSILGNGTKYIEIDNNPANRSNKPIVAG